MTEDQAVLTAVTWWSDKIREGCTEQQLSNFHYKLEELIYSEIATDLVIGYDGAMVNIYCGDHLCEILDYAAVQSGIPELIFPQHVDMVIESYDGGEHYEIRVSDGLGQPYWGLYPVYKRK